MKSNFFRTILTAFLFILLVSITVPVGASSPSSGTALSIKRYYDYLSAKDDCTYIIYEMNGGLNTRRNPEYIKKHGRVTLSEPYKFGYVFAGWYFDGDYKYKANKVYYKPGKSVIVHAKWNRKIDNYYNVENYGYSTDLTLKNLDYSFLDEINIPGMPNTKDYDFFDNLIFSKAQCPQGLCVARDFVLLTSYSEGAGCMGEVMVFDRSEGEYLFTLGMDPDSHLGGITFDGNNIWVCNSAKRCIERLSYDFVENMARQNSGGVISAMGVVEKYPVENTPSCITFYGNRLWIATHSVVFKSSVVAYHYNSERDRIDVLSSYNIPARTQGIAFDEKGKIYLSTSYGRKSSSYLKIYDSLVEMDSDTREPDMTIELPPCSEEIDIVGDNLFMLFESAGEKYFQGTDGKGSSDSPLDKILDIKLKSLKKIN